MGRTRIPRSKSAAPNKFGRPTPASLFEGKIASELDVRPGWSKFFSLLQDFELDAPFERNQPGWEHGEKD